MRRRLIAALTGVAVATLVLYAVPRSLFLAEMVRDREELGLARTADLAAEALDLRLEADLPIAEADLEVLLQGRDDLAMDLVLPDGDRLRAGDVRDVTVAVSRSVGDGGRVSLSLSAATVDDRIADALLPVVAFGALSIAFALGVAVVLARRLAMPFADLAAHADRPDLDADRPAPRAGVPEADQIADALDRNQRRLGDLLRSEREFSSNASHQLRTPLSALRLRIEDLSTWPEIGPAARDELHAALGEVDRLADTVTDLLDLARAGDIGDRRELDLDATAGEAVARWAARFDERGRRLVHVRATCPVRAVGSGRAVHHVLDVLLENALAHGAGTVDVTAQEVDGCGIVRVADEGAFDRGMTEHAFRRSARGTASAGTGIGLDLARRIAESAGAHLRLVSHAPTVFELELPPPAQV